MSRDIVLIGRDGKEKARLPRQLDNPPYAAAWIYYDGAWWGFGVGRLNGELHFYEAPPPVNTYMPYQATEGAAA